MLNVMCNYQYYRLSICLVHKYGNAHYEQLLWRKANSANVKKFFYTQKFCTPKIVVNIAAIYLI